MASGLLKRVSFYLHAGCIPTKPRKVIPLLSLSLVLLISLGFFTSCSEPNAPQPPDLPITLSVRDVGVTSARLCISMDDSTAVRHVRLRRDVTLVLDDILRGLDTIFADRGLSPNSSYSYKAYSLYLGELVDSSNVVQLTTLDTTSRIFTWEVDSIGSYVSILYDASVITDDDIWAVGRLGGWGETPEELQYNALHWNGEEWEKVWIKFLHVSTTGSDSPYALNELTTVHAIRADAVWAAGSTPYFYDGETWTSYQHENSSWDMWTHDVLDIWARNDDDVYFVGRDGYAHHWDGTDFTLLDLGTDMDLTNVSGSEDRIYVVGFNRYNGSSIVIENLQGNWRRLLEMEAEPEDPENGLWGSITSVEVWGDTAYFGAFSGLLKYAYKSETFELVPDGVIGIPYYAIEEVVVLTPGDIHLFNYDERYYQFNGLNWKRYDDHIDLGLHYRGADFNENTAVMIGWLPGIGSMLIRGTR